MLAPQLVSLLKTHYAIDTLQVERKLDTKGQRAAYQIHTEQGRFVLKITDPNRAEEIVKSDIGILHYLTRFDFPAPHPLFTTHGSLYLPYEDRFIYLYSFIEGALPLPTAQFYPRLGALLARLHSIPIDATARVSLHRPPYLLAETRDFLLGATGSEQQRLADDLLASIASFPSFEDLPEGLIHTDPYFVNILSTGVDQLSLIDWDDAGISYPLIDVGYIGHLSTFLPHDRTHLGLPGDEPITWRPDWAQAFLDGYQSVRPLTALEKELFPAAVRLNFIMYIWDWDTQRIIPENYARMKILEEFRPVWY